MHLFGPCKHSGCIVSLIYRKSSFYPPPPPAPSSLRVVIYFKHVWGGAQKSGGPYLGGWSLFDLAKMVLSVLHKLECKVDKPKYKKLEVI